MRVLMYHDVVPEVSRDEVGFSGPRAARYKLTPESFQRHLDALEELALKVGPFRPGESGRSADPDVVLTFDDGGSSANSVAPLLEDRGWRGHFFVTTSRIGTPGFLTRDEIRQIADRGHVIGSHSHTHPTYMGRLERSELEAEWNRSRSLLSAVLGEPPRTASVPGGFLSPEVIASAASAGYEVLFTSEPTARVRSAPLVVVGRFTIWAGTPAQKAAAYARGDTRASARLWAEWNAKQIAKRFNPDVYERLRGVRARFR